MADEIDEILKFLPKDRPKEKPKDVIDEILQFLPKDPAAQEKIGGTYEPKEPPFAGASSPISTITSQPETQYVVPSEPSATFGARMKASIVDDPITKIKSYAESRGISPARYRINKGNIEFRSDSGQWEREIPDTAFNAIESGVADIAAHPSTYLGAAGAATFGVPGAVVGAVAGEGFRKIAGKVMYDEPQDTTNNLLDLGLEGILALGGEMAAKLTSGVINRYLGRKAKDLRHAGYEVRNRLLSPEDHARAAWIKGLADQNGIKLAPHQLYDKEGMTNIWKYLRKHPLTSDAVRKFEENLANQTDAAMDGFIRKMGGYDEEPWAMGKKLKDASTDAITDLKEERKRVADPKYRAALQRREIVDVDSLVGERNKNTDIINRAKAINTPDHDTMLAELKQRGVPVLQQRGESPPDFRRRVMDDYQRITKKPAPMLVDESEVAKANELRKRNEEIDQILRGNPPPGAYYPKKVFKVDVADAMTTVDQLLSESVKGDPSFTALKRIKTMLEAANGDPAKLDRVKRFGIDAVMNKTGTIPSLYKDMATVKTQLTGAMDVQIPAYARARNVFREKSDPIKKMQESIIGTLSELGEGDELSKATAKLFAVKRDPRRMLSARNAIIQQDPGLWDRAIGNYIGDVYHDLVVTEGGKVVNAAGKLQKRLYGSPNQRKMMEAAFGGADKPTFQAFKNLMEVFQRAAIGTGSESMTAPFQAISKEMQANAGSTAYRLLTNTKETAFGWWNDAILMGNQTRLLDALTAPNVQAKLTQLKQLTPNSKKFIESFAVLTTLVANKIESEKLPTRSPDQIQRQIGQQQ